MFKIRNKKVVNNLEGGFTLSVALIMTTIILAVSFSITTIITKSVKISGLATEGAAAYMSAEVGVDCVRTLEDATIAIQRSIGATTTGLFISPTRKVAILNSTAVANANNTNTSPNNITTQDTRTVTSTNIDSVNIVDFECGGNPILAPVGSAPEQISLVNIDNVYYSVSKFSVKSTDANRCSDLEVYKSDDGSMIIISRGYSKCSGADRIARELRVTIN